VHCIIHFALEVMSCTYGHDRTGTTSWMQLRTLLGMHAEVILHLHSCALEVLLEEIYHCCFYWKFIHYASLYSWFYTEVQLYVKSLLN
jgi:hypothetical protein